MRILIIGLLCAGVWFGCSDGPNITHREGVVYVENGAREDTTSFPYDIVLEQTFGTDEEPPDALLSDMVFIAVDTKEMVYVLDNRPPKLTAFDVGGNVVWSMSVQGQGPGEWSDPWGMVLAHDSLLLVGNQNGSRIDFVHTSGRIVERRQYPDGTQGRMERMKVKGMTPDGLLVLDAALLEELSRSIKFVDLGSWQAVDSLLVSDNLGKPVIWGYTFGPPIELTQTHIAAGSLKSEYTFRLYDYSMNLVRHVSRDVDLPGFGMLEGDSGSDVTAGSQLTVLQSLPDGNIPVFVSRLDISNPDEYSRLVTLGQDPDVDRIRSLDIFDAEGRYIASTPARPDAWQMGDPILVMPNGTMYTRVSYPYPHVRRYRLEPN